MAQDSPMVLPLMSLSFFFGNMTAKAYSLYPVSGGHSFVRVVFKVGPLVLYKLSEAFLQNNS